MKKTGFFVVFFVVLAAPALAEQMVVELSSGSKVVVEYSGTIQKVSMEGAGDSIAGIKMEGGVAPAPATKTAATTDMKPTAAPAAEDDQEEGGLRLKWADPIMED